MTGAGETAATRLRERPQEATISALIGVALVFLVTLQGSAPFSAATIAYGALIGLLAYVCSSLLIRIFRGWLSRTRLPARVAHSVLYFAGGAAGWLAATGIAVALSLIRVRGGAAVFKVYLPVVGGITVVVGLAFYAFGLMQDRLRHSVERLKEAEFAEKEIELARSIQQRILPPQELSGDGYRIAARNLPARLVAGDFYDVFRLPDGAVGLVVADVAGKGMGASLIMATVKAALPFLAAERSVEETLSEANRRLQAKLEARQFVALTYARYDPKTGAYELANAGLPDPYVLGDHRAPRAISAPGPRFPLGVRREVAYEKIGGVLAPGERLLLLSDGLPEAPTADGGPLGYERFEALLARNGDADALLEAVRAATGPTLADDWTVLMLERTR
jgi:Stage II sporulation protein E (SpoIIE)